MEPEADGAHLEPHDGRPLVGGDLEHLDLVEVVGALPELLRLRLPQLEGVLRVGVRLRGQAVCVGERVEGALDLVLVGQLAHDLAGLGVPHDEAGDLAPIDVRERVGELLRLRGEVLRLVSDVIRRGQAEASREGQRDGRGEQGGDGGACSHWSPSGGASRPFYPLGRPRGISPTGASRPGPGLVGTVFWALA